MRETKVSEIMGMIEDKADSETSRHKIMAISNEEAPMGFYTWYRSDLIRETLREVPDEPGSKTQ